jgi:hypothetical protein
MARQLCHPASDWAPFTEADLNEAQQCLRRLADHTKPAPSIKGHHTHSANPEAVPHPQVKHAPQAQPNRDPS